MTINLILKTNIDNSSKPILRLPKDYLHQEKGRREICLSIPEKKKNKVIQEMHNFISVLSENHKDNVSFWYTPVSEMQPFMSCIYRAIEFRASLYENLDKLKGDYVFIDQSIFLLYFIKSSFFKKINIINMLSIRLLYICALSKNLLLRYLNILLWLFENLCHIKNTKKLGKLPTQLDFLIISRFELKNNEILTEPWFDSYLGDMPETLSRFAKIAILGRCSDSPGILSKTLSQFSQFPLWTVYQYIHVKDLFLIVWTALKFRLNTKGVSDKPLANLAYSESRNHCRAIADCLLVEYALKNLLKKIAVDKIIIMQENCAWETSVVVSARQFAIPVIGYFHCPVIPESFRYHMNKAILKYRPLPDKVLTLGKEMTRAMNKLGDWGNLLIDGYAFRNPLVNVVTRKIKNNLEIKKRKKILVLLGGNYCNVKFLKWLNMALEEKDVWNWQYLVKGHPRLCAKTFLKKAKILYGIDKLFYPLETNASFEKILPETDCIVFKGTTAGIIGLAAGVPTIHICHNGVETDNVLFNAKQFCYSINSCKDFKKALEKIIDEFTFDQNARKYAFSYYERNDRVRMEVLNFLKS